MTADLSALIARLEAAHATGIIMMSEAVALQSALGLEDAHDTDWKQCCWNALKGSLDAALALASRLELHGDRLLFEVLEAGEFKSDRLALALVIAILRAKQGEA